MGHEVAFRALLDPDSAGLGDPVRLTIEVDLPAGSRPVLPGDGDSLGAWKILRAGPVRRVRGDGWERTTREITVAGYRLGRIGPDTLWVGGTGAKGDSLRLAYAPRRLDVRGQLAAGEAADPSKLKDIRDVVSTGPPRWPWFAAGAAALIAAALLAARRIRSRRRAAAASIEPPGPSAEEEFEAAIARLLADGLLEGGLYREFYYGVSRAVRLYLERTQDLPLLESTSMEVMDLLSPRIEGAGERAALGEWLAEGDLVKYARMERLQAEALSYLERSRGLVRLLAALRPGAGQVAAETGAPAGARAGAGGPAAVPATPSAPAAATATATATAPTDPPESREASS